MKAKFQMGKSSTKERNWDERLAVKVLEMLGDGMTESVIASKLQVHKAVICSIACSEDIFRFTESEEYFCETCERWTTFKPCVACAAHGKVDWSK